MALPPFDYQAPPQLPAHSGLYDVASIDPVTARIAGGVNVWPYNCGPSGTWPSDVCLPPGLTEQQTITITGQTGGTFTAAAGSLLTSDLDWDATGTEIEAALNLLPEIIAAGGVVVSGGPLPGTVTVTWNVPGDQPLLTLDTTNLTGTVVSDVAAVREGTGSAKAGDRPAISETFFPVLAWGYDECGDLGSSVHADRATVNLQLNEHLYVESAFATRILADAGAPAASVNVWAAVAQLEAVLAADGLIGVIHASTYWTTIALGVGLITKQGAVYRTARGTAWADGGGYDGVLGDTLVATGQVFLWRDPITVTEAFSHTANLKVAVAERTVLAAYEPCHAAAVTVPALTADQF